METKTLDLAGRQRVAILTGVPVDQVNEEFVAERFAELYALVLDPTYNLGGDLQEQLENLGVSTSTQTVTRRPSGTW